MVVSSSVNQQNGEHRRMNREVVSTKGDALNKVTPSQV
jgi:hypothetical protein